MLFADATDTSWQDVVLEVVKLLGLLVTGYFAAAAASRSGRTEIKTDVAAKDASTAANEARSGRMAAQTAAAVVVETSLATTETLNKVVDQTARTEVQGTRIEQQTNGMLEAERRSHAATRAKYEALLAATMPSTAAEAIKHIPDQVLEKVLGASKSGVIRITTPVDPQNPPKRRHDDPHD